MGATPTWKRRWAEVFGLDLRSLALLRILLGLLLLADLASRSQDLCAHYTDAGMFPRSAVAGPAWVSLHMASGEAWFQAVLFAVAAGFALMLLVGYQTRLATVASWYLLVSLQWRNYEILQGGDLLFRLLLFWGIFLPLGARWSLDARLDKAPPPADNLVVSGGTVGYILQLCFMYWFAVVQKWHPVWTTEWTAVYYALHIDHFAKPLGVYLRQFPLLLPLATVGTLLLEGLGPVFLFLPWAVGRIRLAVIAAFLFFHLVALNLCLELGPFPYVCAAGWLALLPGCFWDRLPFAKPAAVDTTVRETPSPWVNVLAGFLIVYIFLCNVRTSLPCFAEQYWPAAGFDVGDMFAVNQVWGMFSPYPLREDGWFVVVGTLEDGTQVDLFRKGEPVCWDKPEWVVQTYPNEHWRKCMMNMLMPGQDDLRVRYCRWLGRTWNAAHEGARRLQSVEIVYMAEMTYLDHIDEPRPKLLCKVYCGE